MLLQRLPTAELVIPFQCLGEFSRVLTGNAGCRALVAQEAELSWMDAYHGFCLRKI
jgi:hypothetical protein